MVMFQRNKSQMDYQLLLLFTHFVIEENDGRNAHIILFITHFVIEENDGRNAHIIRRIGKDFSTNTKPMCLQLCAAVDNNVRMAPIRKVFGQGFKAPVEEGFAIN
jgi:hypothetical protein